MKLSEFPVQSLHFPSPEEGVRKAILLPQDQSSNVLAGLTGSGSLILMDALKLKLLSQLEPPAGTDFVTLTYCNSEYLLTILLFKTNLNTEYE